MSHLKKAAKNKYVPAVLVALVAFVVYLACLRNEFVWWDDNYYIYDNPAIRSLDPAFFRWAFFDFYYSNWHPLTWISHALDYAVWGMNPLGHHLTNIVLHAINTFLVVLLVQRLLEAHQGMISDKISPAPSLPKRGTTPATLNPTRPPLKVREGEGGLISEGDRGGLSDKQILIAAGMTGLLFGIHPLHVESVAWVSERKDLLCALFFLGSVMMYMRHAGGMATANPPIPPLTKGGRGGIYKYYILSLILFILALMSKPMAVSLPVVLLILDWSPYRRIGSLKTFWRAALEKLPFVVFSLASSVLTVLAQQAGGALKPIEFAAPSIRLLVAFKSLIFYLWKTLMPLGLSPFYPYPKDVSLISPEYAVTIALVIGITAACVMFVRKEKLPLAVWGYYVITLIPVLGIVQVGGQAMADRYMYLPGIGPFLVLGLAAAWGWDKIAASRASARSVYAGAAMVVILSLSFLTVRQIGVWQNSISLLSSIIEFAPGRVPFAYYNRGMIYENMGRLDEAVDDFDKAITANPQYSEAYNNRGIVFNKLGRPDRALPDFNRALALNPGNARGFINRGLLYLKANQVGPAVSDFRKACELGENFGCAMVQYAEKMR